MEDDGIVVFGCYDVVVGVGVYCKSGGRYGSLVSTVPYSVSLIERETWIGEIIFAQLPEEKELMQFF